VEDILLPTPRLHRRPLILLLLILVAAVASAKPHPGVSYVKTQSAGVSLHLVDVDLNRTDLIVRPVVVPTGHRKPFSQMVQQCRPVAAVNGTFFDTNTGITVGNLVSEGRLLSEGMVGSNLVFNKDGTMGLLSSSRNLGRYKDWSEVEFAIGGGPTLVSDGRFFMQPSREGFKDPSLFVPRPRSAIGVTENGHLRMVVVTQNITLWQLAHVMKELKCLHAINLDGGSSTGLSVGGTTMVKPGRKLTNIVGVFASHMEPELNRAVRVAESRALAHYEKGQRLLDQGELRLARSQMRQAVAKAPDQAGFWRAAGVTELMVGNPGRASKDLYQASSLYIQRGDIVAAMQVAERILEFDALNVSAHLICGECKVEQGLDQEAEIHLSFVLNSQPGHPKATELFEVINFRKRTLQGLRTSGDAISRSLAFRAL
jgi:uncharacterized protein YigE (DUF2233 family)